MKKPKVRVFSDSWTMSKRCVRIAFRDPSLFVQAIIVPAFIMWIFGTVFGSIADIGDVGDFNYISFIVPGVILQAVAQANISAAITVTNDMTKGIVDRFRSMPIAKSAVLIGHVFAAVIRNTISTVIIIGVAFLIGFRPVAGFVDWLAIAGILLLYILAITWIAVVCGLAAKTLESSGTMLTPLFILPFLSSAFAPTEALPRGLRWFAENQPMTHIIDSVRGFMLDVPSGNALPLALAWSIGIIVVAFVAAVQIYKRKLV